MPVNTKYPLATTTWDDREYQAIQDVIETGRFSMGEKVMDFEKAFSSYIGSNYSVMVNSGSSANLLMVAALFFTKQDHLKLRPGDEIIVPAVSWGTTYFPLQQYGLHLKFVDIDLDTLNYDLDQLELAISESTRAIMAVNLLGNPNDYGRISNLIGDRSIVLLEDNCESLGAELEGQLAGTFGVLGTFSSFFSHHISTMEGGVVVTDDEELYHIMLSLRAHGWTRNLPNKNHVCGTKRASNFEESFRFVLPGYNLRPLEMSGAIGVEQIKKIPSILAGRRENAASFVDKMAKHSELLIQKEIGKSSWFGFSLIIKPESLWSRNNLVAKLEKLGFECRPIVAGDFTENSVLDYFDYEIFGELKNAKHLHKNGLFIGNHHYSIDNAIHELATISLK